MIDYLEMYVILEDKSKTIETTLEFSKDVKDAIEVSVRVVYNLPALVIVWWIQLKIPALMINQVVNYYGIFNMKNRILMVNYFIKS